MKSLVKHNMLKLDRKLVSILKELILGLDDYGVEMWIEFI